MPPGPIDGSCLPSPTAMSFAPECSTSSVSASRRWWSAIPASSTRKIVVAWSTWMLPVRARATSESRVSVRPFRDGVSAPSRSAVLPDTAIPSTVRPACSSALAAASMTMLLPVPAGPMRTPAPVPRAPIPNRPPLTRDDVLDGRGVAELLHLPSRRSSNTRAAGCCLAASSGAAGSSCGMKVEAAVRGRSGGSAAA
jgi:hypothetical protein